MKQGSAEVQFPSRQLMKGEGNLTLKIRITKILNETKAMNKPWREKISIGI